MHGGCAARLHACLIGGLQCRLQAPNGHVVKVKAVGVARFKGFDKAVIKGDLCKERFDDTYLSDDY